MDKQIIILFVLMVCIIICFKLDSLFLCILIGGLIVSIMYKDTKKNSDHLVNFPSLLKNIEQMYSNNVKITENNSLNKDTSELNVTKKDNFYIDKDKIIISNDNMNLEKLIENTIEQHYEEKSEEQVIEKTVEQVVEKPIEQSVEHHNKNEKFITREDIPTYCQTDNMLDGDEKIAYNSIHRNEPTRVIYGIGRAYQNLNRYVLEEVEEIEGKEWWGNNDY